MIASGPSGESGTIFHNKVSNFYSISFLNPPSSHKLTLHQTLGRCISGEVTTLPTAHFQSRTTL